MNSTVQRSGNKKTGGHGFVDLVGELEAVERDVVTQVLCRVRVGAAARDAGDRLHQPMVCVRSEAPTPVVSNRLALLGRSARVL